MIPLSLSNYLVIRMQNFVNGYLSFRYHSAAGSPSADHPSVGASAAAVEQKAAPVAAAIPNAGGSPDEITQAESSAPLTIHVSGNQQSEAVLFVTKNDSNEPKVQPFRIQTLAHPCIIVTNIEHQTELYNKIDNHYDKRQQKTINPYTTPPKCFEIEVSTAGTPWAYNGPVRRSVAFMSPADWFTHQIRNNLFRRHLSKTYFILDEMDPPFPHEQTYAGKLIAEFLTPKVTSICLERFDRDTNEICYSMNVNGSSQNYRTLLPEDGTLNLRNILGINNSSNYLFLVSIATRAFYACDGLKSVVIQEGVTSIGQSAFAFCASLMSVVMPEGVTSIGQNAFSWCRNLTNIVIPASVTSIGPRAFHDCCRLASIVIPEGVTSIGQNAFSWCRNLTNIVIPASVTSIGKGAFAFCTGLKSVIILASVTSIGKGAFAFCTGLTSVVISASVTSIDKHAFEHCYSLHSVTCTRNFYDKNKSKLRSIFGSNISKITFLDPEGVLIRGPLTAKTSVSIGAAVLLSVAAVAVGCCMIPFGAIAALIIATRVVGGLAVTSVGVASGLGIMSHITTQKAKAMQAPVA